MKGSSARDTVLATVACRGMSHRFSTWWRALSVVLLSLATVTWPSAARADTTPLVSVVHESALVRLSPRGTAHVTTTLMVSPASVAVRADVTLFPSLVTRTQLNAIVTGAGTTASPLASTGPFPLNCRHHGEVTFDVTINTQRASRPARSCAGVAPRLRLRCPIGRCGGVYPLRYRTDVGGAIVTTWSLLALQSAPVTQPLAVALVETMPPNTLTHPKRSLAALAALSDFPNAALTLGADYRTLASIELDARSHFHWRATLSRALASPLHLADAAPPGGVDFAGLASHGLKTQVAQQLVLSTDLVHALTGHVADLPVVLNGPQSPASLAALGGAGVHDVVVPEGDLAVAPSNTLTWGAPFLVPGAGPIDVLATDQPLSALVGDRGVSPGLRSALTLATLAFLHFEEPNVPVRRTVVIEAPLGSTSAVFLHDLLSGFANDPFSQLTPLTPLFNPALVGTDGAPTVRVLATPAPSSHWSGRNVSSLLTLIGAINSFDQSIQSGEERTVLHVAVARSEVVATSSARQSDIAAANALLNAQLSAFSINDSAITLAGQGTSLPITVISHAPYRVRAVLHVVTTSLSFPQGGNVPVTLSSPTQSIRVTTAKPLDNSLTLQVVLTTPNDQIVLARAALQVRVDGVSFMGYLLSVASLFVLALWWWRTNRRRPRGRHAR